MVKLQDRAISLKNVGKYRQLDMFFIDKNAS